MTPKYASNLKLVVHVVSNIWPSWVRPWHVSIDERLILCCTELGWPKLQKWGHGDWKWVGHLNAHSMHISIHLLLTFFCLSWQNRICGIYTIHWNPQDLHCLKLSRIQSCAPEIAIWCSGSWPHDVHVYDGPHRIHALKLWMWIARSNERLRYIWEESIEYTSNY